MRSTMQRGEEIGMTESEMRELEAIRYMWEMRYGESNPMGSATAVSASRCV